MKQIFSNIKLIFSNSKYLAAYVVLVVIFAWLWYTFTDLKLMRGNYAGTGRFELDLVLSWINILAFPLFILAWIYRSYTLGNHGHNAEKAGFFGGILGILISGSLCCGTSVFMVFGASVIITFAEQYLPYKGMEIKMLGATILLFALFFLLKNLLVCKRKKTKKSS